MGDKAPDESNDWEKILFYIKLIDEILWKYLSEKYHTHVKPEIQQRILDLSRLHPELEKEIKKYQDLRMPFGNEK